MKRSLILITLALGCHKTAASVAADSDAASLAGDGGMVAAVAPDDADAAADIPSDVAPPAAVVAADPGIPLNEAVVGAAPVAPGTIRADTAPPAPVVEDQTPTPYPSDTSVPGYWACTRPLAKYVWVSGAWRNAPPQQVWTPGSWGFVSGHYGWTPGYWGPRGYAREMIAEALLPLQVEVRSAMPGVGSAWTPGYYDHSGGRLMCGAPASWNRPESPGVVWIEPSFVSTGGRYYLQRGLWVYAADHRGTVYSPNINARPGAFISRPFPRPYPSRSSRCTRTM